MNDDRATFHYFHQFFVHALCSSLLFYFFFSPRHSTDAFILRQLLFRRGQGLRLTA